MKTIICVLAIAAFATSREIATNSIASSFKDLLESIRDDMPCGFPLLGIGSLAPLFISQANVQLDTPALKILGTVHNFTVNNLNGFEVLQTKHNLIKRTLTFSLLFENIEVDTQYDLKSEFKESGWTVKLNGSGNAYFALEGLLVSVSSRYAFNIIDSRINLKALSIVPHLDSVVSRIEGILGHGIINAAGNKELERLVPVFVNTFSEVIAKKIEAILLPVCNSFFYQYTLNDILDSIGGNSAGGEKIKCQPAEQGVLSSF